MAADDRKGAYAEVEHLKKGKWRIKRDYNRLNIVIAAAIAITLLFFFTAIRIAIQVSRLPLKSI